MVCVLEEDAWFNCIQLRWIPPWCIAGGWENANSSCIAIFGPESSGVNCASIVFNFADIILNCVGSCGFRSSALLFCKLRSCNGLNYSYFNYAQLSWNHFLLYSRPFRNSLIYLRYVCVNSTTKDLNSIFSIDVSIAFWVVSILPRSFLVHDHVWDPYVSVGIIQLLKIWLLWNGEKRPLNVCLSDQYFFHVIPILLLISFCVRFLNDIPW